MNRFSGPVSKLLLLFLGIALIGRPLVVILHNHLARTNHPGLTQAQPTQAKSPLLKKHFREFRRVAKQNPRPKLDLAPSWALERKFTRESFGTRIFPRTEPFLSPDVTLRI